MEGNTIIKKFIDPETGTELVVIISYNDPYVELHFGEKVEEWDRIYLNVDYCAIKKEFLGDVIEVLNEVYKKIKEEGGKNG